MKGTGTACRFRTYSPGVKAPCAAFTLKRFISPTGIAPALFPQSLFYRARLMFYERSHAMRLLELPA